MQLSQRIMRLIFKILPLLQHEKIYIINGIYKLNIIQVN